MFEPGFDVDNHEKVMRMWIVTLHYSLWWWSSVQHAKPAGAWVSQSLAGSPSFLPRPHTAQSHPTETFLGIAKHTASVTNQLEHLLQGNVYHLLPGGGSLSANWWRDSAASSNSLRRKAKVNFNTNVCVSAATGIRNEILSTHSRCEVISHSSSSCSCSTLTQLSTGVSTDSSPSLFCTHTSSHTELQNWQTQTSERRSTRVNTAANQHCGCEGTS